MEKPDDNTTPTLTPAEALKTATQRIEAAITLGEKKLDLSDLCSLRELPENICQATQITTLILGKTAQKHTQVSDITALSKLPALRGLWLDYTLVCDLTALVGMRDIQILHLNNTRVWDISALSGLSGLETLWLNHTDVSDITALSQLHALHTLWLNNTPVHDLTALCQLSGLRELSLCGTPVVDVAALAHLPCLSGLYVSGTKIRDLRPLLNCTNLADNSGFWGLSYQNTLATDKDATLAKLADIVDEKERGQHTFSYLRRLPDWPEPLV